MKNVKWFTQEILFETVLFGREYYWMKDIDGRVYLARKMPDKLPAFLSGEE